jgi:hypothetical protein
MVWKDAARVGSLFNKPLPEHAAIRHTATRHTAAITTQCFAGLITLGSPICSSFCCERAARLGINVEAAARQKGDIPAADNIHTLLIVDDVC